MASRKKHWEMMDIGQGGSTFLNVHNACDLMHNILTLLKVHFYGT